MRWIVSFWCVFLLAAGAWADGTIRVTVRDIWTQRPLPGAILETKAVREAPDGIMFKANNEGVILSGPLSSGEIICTARGLIDGIPYRQESLTILVKDDEITEVEVYLFPMKERTFSLCAKMRPKDWGEARFTVVDAHTKKPLEGVIALLEPNEIEGDVQGDKTNVRGEAWIGHKPGTYRYAVVGFVNGTFYKRQYGEVTILPGKDEKRTIELQPVRE